MNPVLKVGGKQYNEKPQKSYMPTICSCFLSTYYMPGTVIGARQTARKNKTVNFPFKISPLRIILQLILLLLSPGLECSNLY